MTELPPPNSMMPAASELTGPSQPSSRMVLPEAFTFVPCWAVMPFCAITVGGPAPTISVSSTCRVRPVPATPAAWIPAFWKSWISELKTRSFLVVLSELSWAMP